MFTTDRDLLVLEPNLLRAAIWAGQTAARGEASLDSGALILPGADFFAADVQPGDILLFAGVPLEVRSVEDFDKLLVSLPRADPDDPFRTPLNNPGAEAVVVTFRHQRNLVHHQLLAMLDIGVGPTSQQPEGTLGSDRITNPRDLARLESLGALHHIFAAASLLLGQSSDAFERARMYADRFERERWRASARIDTDGDNIPDATRRFNLTMLTRT